MYDIIYIHSRPVELQNDAVEISTLSTIPKHLQEAVSIVDYQLLLDSNTGCKTAPIGSVVCYEKSNKTASGYNCWAIGKIGIDLVKNDGIFYTKPTVIPAMLIPAPEDPKPLWVHGCHLIYNGDGTATLNIGGEKFTGRIGIDFLLCFGMKQNGIPQVRILSTYDKSYNDYMICDETGKDIGKLCELYPA